jgi:olefin beta-lactone synthetase
MELFHHELRASRAHAHAPPDSCAARLPPDGLPGLDPSWSRLVFTPGVDRVGRTWHVLDNNAADPVVTLFCVHGNPTWSYLWRHVLQHAPDRVRVIAVDQLDMGFSERTQEARRLPQRIDDIDAVSAALEVRGPVVSVGHDWGGPISLGWAHRHRAQLDGIVLLNTAVHQPSGSRAPGLIRLARLPGALPLVCATTPTFVDGALALAAPKLTKDVRRAYHAPYLTAARRRAIAGFVDDIPLDDAHPSAGALDQLIAAISTLADVPALLLWGPSDPVFSDLYLDDLIGRFRRVDVHRFIGASHMLPEHPDVAPAIHTWVTQRGRPPVPERPRVTRAAAWSVLDERSSDADVAMVEMSAHGVGRAASFASLSDTIWCTTRALAHAGINRGDRIALLIPPGLELTACLYAAWRLGAVVVFVDAGLGVRGMTSALKSARPKYLIGIRRALVAARVLGWPGTRISAEALPAAVSLVVQTHASLEDLRNRAPTCTPDEPDDTDLAAIVFTSGATGPAKGVRYRHFQLQAQRDLLADVYGISRADRAVAAFAPFALYGPALGVPSIVPDMDVTAPATLRATALADAVAAIDATLIFAAPMALKNVVASAADLDSRQLGALAGVRLLLSAGAPVRPALLRAAAKLLPNASAHTPYGMTEVLPVTDISLDQIEAAGRGNGVCVGLPVPGVSLAIAPLDAEGGISAQLTSTPGVVGEICIDAPHVKDGYDKLWLTQARSAIAPHWHRSGDVGHLDDGGRLWVEGRTVHVVWTSNGPVTPVTVELPVEDVPGVSQAAAVGVGPVGTQQLVVVVVPDVAPARAALANATLAERVRARVEVDVAAVLVVPRLPVDNRHNSKIDRTRVARWAERLLAGQRVRTL